MFSCVGLDFGERRMGEKLMNHVDLCIATDIVEFKKGVAASDGRGFYLIEEGTLLNEALQAFLRKRGYMPRLAGRNLAETD